jgi:hypothetical protein
MRNGELERKYLRLGAGAVRGGGVHGVHAFKAGGDRVVGRRRKWAPVEQCRRSERGRRALARGNLAGLGTRAWARLTEHGTVGTGSLGRGRVSLACTTPYMVMPGNKFHAISPMELLLLPAQSWSQLNGYTHKNTHAFLSHSRCHKQEKSH